MNIKRSSRKKTYLKNGKLILSGKKTYSFKKNKLILRRGATQRGGLLPFLKVILSNLNLTTWPGKIKRAVLKVAVLPNSKQFPVRCKRTARSPLPDIVTLNRTCKQKAARQNRIRCQRGRGIGSLIKKVIKNPIVRKLTKEARVK